MNATVNQYEAEMLCLLADKKTVRVLIEACEALKPRTMGADVYRLRDLIECAKELHQ